MLIAYPPWLRSGYYYPSDYGTSPVHIQALAAFNGYDPYIEMVYCVIVRVLVGMLGKGYFALVRFRDNLIITMSHQE